MFVTLDYNCIVALENNEEPHAATLSELVALCKRVQIPVYVYSYLFLENPRRDGKRLDLQKALEAVGQGHIQTRSRDTIWFNDNGALSYEEETPFMCWVHQTMFPTVAYSWEVYLAGECVKAGIEYQEMLEANRDKRPPLIPASPYAPPVRPADRFDPARIQQLREQWEKFHRKWNNRKSDSLALCAHISWGAGIFVTSNESDFQRKEQQLRKRVPFLRILTPPAALAAIQMVMPEQPREEKAVHSA